MRLLLSGNSWDGVGGLERYFRSVAEGLAARGHSVTCLAVRGGAAPPRIRLRELGAPSSPLPQRMWRSYVQARAVARDCDVFNPHFAPYAIGPALALRAVPMIFSFHGPWAWEDWVERRSALRRESKRFLERLLYRRARAVVTASLAFKSLLVERYGVDAGRIHVLPAGVDLDLFHPGRGRAEARRGLELPADRPILVAARRLVKRTGVDLLLDAVRPVVARRPDVLLLVAGQGPLRSELEARVRDLGLDANVRFLGFVPDERLVAYYRAATAVAMPSLELEGFGLTTVEALACGTPVVGTPVGGTPEILGRLEPRLLARHVSAPALAETLLAVLDHPEWVPDAARCRRFVEREHGWTRVVDALEGLFQATLVAFPGGAPSARPTRVAYVNSDAELSGAEINLLQTVAAVPPARVAASFVVPRRGELAERTQATGLPCFGVDLGRARLGGGPLRLAAGLLALVVGAWRVGRAVRWADADLVHANSTRAGLMASLGRALHGRPVVWSVHDFLPGGLVGEAIRLAARLGAARVIVNSEAVGRDLEGGRWFRPPLRRIYPVLPSDSFDGRNHRDARAAVGIPPDAFVVGYVGQIAPWKRVHDAIEAFAIVAAAVPGARLIVAGAPKFREENRRYDAELRALVGRRGLGGRVDFVGFQADVLEVYAVLDALVHPASREPFGRVVAEAMAQRLPVVASADGGIPEIVLDGVTGILCRVGDVDGLARGLVGLARDPAGRRRMGAAGAERARAVFHVDRAVQELLDVYAATLRARRGWRPLAVSRT